MSGSTSLPPRPRIGGAAGARGGAGEPGPDPEPDLDLHAWLHALFGGAPDGVAVSLSGRLLYVNPRLESLLGADGSLAGRPSLELYPEDEWADVLLRTQSMAFTGRPSTPRVHRLAHRDGGHVELEVAALLLARDDAPLLIEVARALADRPDL